MGSPGGSAAARSAGRSEPRPSVAGRTIVETAACPPDLKRGEACWSFSDFRVQRMLGEGNMSSVLQCMDERSGLGVVVKMYHKDRMNTMNVKQVSREIELHAGLLHPNIIKLYAAFEDSDGVYLVEEHAPRGDLYGDLSRRGGYMTESHVGKAVLLPFLSALSYLHSHGILHRDIKPENIMLGEASEIKLGDFGLAINVIREKPMSRVGTLDYMPPEIVRLSYGARAAVPPVLPPPSSGSGGSGATPADAAPEASASYGLPADVWCVGVLAYELLVGGPPFEAETKDATYTRILKTQPSIPGHLSEQARDFISQALRKDPTQRPTVAHLLRHTWLRTYQRPHSMRMLDVAVCTDSVTLAGQPSSQQQQQLQQETDREAAVAAAAAAAVAAAVAAANESGGAASPGASHLAMMSRAISFNSSLVGRFTPMPSKPAALNQLVLQQNSRSNSAGPAGPGLGSQAVADAARSTTAVPSDTIPALVAEGSRAKVLGPEGSGSKLVVWVEATPGTPDAAAGSSAGGCPSGSGGGGLIRAVLQGGAEGGSDGTAWAGRAGDSPRPESSFAAFRRKLSAKSLGSVLSGLAGSDRAVSRDGASFTAGSPPGRASGVAPVQAPSMLELLSPARALAAAGSRPLGPKRHSSKLLSAFGRKLSLGNRISGGWARTSRAASRLSGAQGPGGIPDAG